MKIDVTKCIPEGMELVEKMVKPITKALIRNEGYCPCVPENKRISDKEDYKCPCKFAREDKYCCCGIYVKE